MNLLFVRAGIKIYLRQLVITYSKTIQVTGKNCDKLICLYQRVGWSNFEIRIYQFTWMQACDARVTLADGAHEPVLYLFQNKTVNCNMQGALGKPCRNHFTKLSLEQKASITLSRDWELSNYFKSSLLSVGDCGNRKACLFYLWIQIYFSTILR